MLAFKPGLKTADVRLDYETRADGGLRVTSPDEPGLILGGSDPERTRSVIASALTSLLEHNRGIKVHALEVRGDHARVTYSTTA